MPDSLPPPSDGPADHRGQADHRGRNGLRVLNRAPLDADAAPGHLAVLVHGAMDRATSFTRLAGKLRDWELVSYDRRGYAWSSHLGPPEDFEVQVHDLVEVLDGRPAVAFGHSLGGDVVLATMARHPGLITAALVWEPPQPWLPFWPSASAAHGAGSHLGPEDRAEWFMRRLVGDRIWERLPSATRTQRRAEGPTLDADLRTLGEGPVFDPAAIRAPVLVGRGGRSQVHHRRAARELATALPAGRLVEIADAGHGAHVSHPGEVGTLIRSLVDGPA